ncbi:MAG: terminase family protein [Candidatus Methanomethylophilaceae archaeon]|nr:terminase family protein [Candidatus Methanomethylophilaceae archaeon]
MNDVSIVPFSPVVRRRIQCHDRLQFYEGPVRSGKTLASLISLIYYIGRYPVRFGIMSGNTIGSVIRNCIKTKLGFLDLCPSSKLIKRDNVYQLLINTDHGEVIIYLFGADNTSSDDPLRGLTADFWYADEITKHHENFIKEAVARLAASEYPFMIWTSNPDNPRNRIYTEYTDKYLAMTPEQKAEFGGYHEFHFKLSDNPIMTPEKIRALELTYAGVEYRRKVLGERCIAEGLVYPFFGDSCIRAPPETAKVRWASIDFGTVHPTAMGWYAYDKESKTYYKVREWKGSAEQSASMTTAEYMDVFERITEELGGIPRMNLTIDYGGGGEALVREAERRHWMPQTPDKAVLDGISVLARLLNTHRLYISPECPETIEGLYTYHWDQKASERGEDKPVKIDDDLADETRYAASTFIEPRIRR